MSEDDNNNYKKPSRTNLGLFHSKLKIYKKREEEIEGK